MLKEQVEFIKVVATIEIMARIDLVDKAQNISKEIRKATGSVAEIQHPISKLTIWLLKLGSGDPSRTTWNPGPLIAGDLQDLTTGSAEEPLGQTSTEETHLGIPCLADMTYKSWERWNPVYFRSLHPIHIVVSTGVSREWHQFVGSFNAAIHPNCS